MQIFRMINFKKFILNFLILNSLYNKTIRYQIHTHTHTHIHARTH